MHKSQNDINKTSCKLCDVVKESLDQGSQTKKYNSKLFETENFIIIPALGPLCVGHVMVTSKYHQQNLLSSTKNLWKEYDEIISIVTKINQKYYSNLLEAEHGGFENYNSGACINHTHINLIPNFGNIENIFAKLLTPLQSASNISDIKSYNKPYVSIRGNSKNIKIYDGMNLPSQFIRRVIANYLGYNTWEWGKYYKLNDVSKTINLWK